jgi:uncharacterized protein YqeY
MRAKDTLRRDTLRFVLAAIQREGVDRLGLTLDRLAAEGKDEAARAALVAEQRPGELDDRAVQEVLQKQAKMRRDSIEAFRKGGRAELADKEERELAIIGEYLPQQLGEAQIREIVERAIAQTGAAGPRDMGKVMSAVLAETKDRADGKQVSGLVQSLLKAKAG